MLQKESMIKFPWLSEGVLLHSWVKCMIEFNNVVLVDDEDRYQQDFDNDSKLN